MPVVTRGDREISARFDTFPARARRNIQERIEALTERLKDRIVAAAPRLTGLLQSEIVERTFDNNPNRVAGYVSVYAPTKPGEYAKAATLEYGTQKPRRSFERENGVTLRLGRAKRRIAGRLSKPVNMAPFEYLRGPLEQMRPEIEAGINQAVADTAEGE